MKAVILAAGIGSRLRPMTNSKPKCLVTTAGKTILQYQLDAYKKAGIRDVCIVVGYEKQAILDYCKHNKDFNFHVIDNDVYEDTNNMYSFYLTKDWLAGEAFILNNADVAIDENIVEKLLSDPRENLIAVDASIYNDESMKVSVSTDGIINNIAKDIREPDAAGSSIDFYKFSAESSKLFIAKVTEIIEHEKNLKDWTEVSMQRMFQSGELAFQCFDVSGLPWVEIDNYEDLASSDLVFSNYKQWEKEITDVYFDLDGTVYLKDKVIAGASDTLAKLSAKKNVYFISNNSSKNKCELVEKLQNMGINTNEENIILSFDAVIAFLKSKRVTKIYVLGTASLSRVFLDSGFELDENNPEYIVLGYDTELTYGKLAKSCQLIHQGVDYLATHTDNFCPTSEGPIPDAGAMIKMLEVTTGKSPTHVFGKPSIQMLEGHLAAHGAPKENCLLVGDRLHTDIEMATRCGIRSALVLTGETSRDMLETNEHKPCVTINSINDLRAS